MVPIVMGWGGGHPGTSPGSLEGKKILMTTYSEFKVAQDEIHVHVSARNDGAGPYAATIRLTCVSRKRYRHQMNEAMPLGSAPRTSDRSEKIPRCIHTSFRRPGRHDPSHACVRDFPCGRQLMATPLPHKTSRTFLSAPYARWHE
jgi:hypothetical protein